VPLCGRDPGLLEGGRITRSLMGGVFFIILKNQQTIASLGGGPPVPDLDTRLLLIIPGGMSETESNSNKKATNGRSGYDKSWLL